MLAVPRIRLEWPEKQLDRAPPASRLVERVAGDAGLALVEGDNLAALAALRAAGERDFGLAYLDPPFFTGRRFDRVRRSRAADGSVQRELTVGFDDRWDGLETWLGALAARLVLVRELLAPHGCLVLHVDPKTSHYAKLVCDEIFGARAFQSEIVWRYRRWPSKTRNFQRVHDVLLRYVRDPDAEHRFTQLYEPLAASTRATWGDKKQRAVVGDGGRRLRSSSTDEASLGVPLGDVWEIGIVAPIARERTGYPTQKPEALLARLVESCTLPGDRVLDPYLGSGTSLAVAHRLGRRGLGIDENAEALGVARDRLGALGARPAEYRCEPLAPGPASARRRTSMARLAG
jgi:DNA modification methylase